MKKGVPVRTNNNKQQQSNEQEEEEEKREIFNHREKGEKEVKKSKNERINDQM